MMSELFAEGVTYELLLGALTAFTFLYFISRRYFSTGLSIVIALVKAGIPFIYFAWFNDGQWLLGDDVMYFERGGKILEMEPNVMRALIDPDIRELLESQAGGSHILYGWWNALAITLFGDYYFSPIFLNIILTGVTAAFLYHVIELSGFTAIYCRFVTFSFLMHWDILAWSSFVNLKDNFVLMLTVVSFYFGMRLLQRFSLVTFGLLLLNLLAFYWIRYYIPVFIVAALALWVLLRWQSTKKFIFFPLLVATLYFVFPWGSVPLDRISFNEVLYGAVRYVLTPQPWSVDEEYGFLLIPSLMHWITMPVAIAGAVILWRQTATGQILLLYTAILIAFYAVVPELQGPRHRVQIEFFIVWLQCAGLWQMLHATHLVRSPSRYNRQPSV